MTTEVDAERGSNHPLPQVVLTTAKMGERKCFSKPNFETGAIPYPNFRDLQKENRTFSAMAISRGFGFSLIGHGEPERVTARLVSADFFSVLDVKPALGRGLCAG